MNAMQRERLKVLFDEALGLPPGTRAAFVAGACGGDAALRDELLSLLGDYEASAGYFEELAERLVAPALAAVDGGAREEFAPGETVAHYEILVRLGGGGMGVVYQARDLRLGRRVALKFLPPALLADEAARARLIAEAKAASALDHPNIAVVHEIAETEAGRPFIAMAWYEGETLKEKLARGSLPVLEALELAAQLADALAAAHNAGIVHRDVKPANVLITGPGVAKLLDFGIAKVSGVELTGEGATPGTLAYMSPEQTHGRVVDARSDLWSLGVVLYEMLGGRRPFPAQDEPALVHAIRHDEPEPLARLRPELPAELVEIVGTCLEKDPARRYASAEALASALRAVAVGARVEESPVPRRRGLSAGRQPLRQRTALGAVAMLLLLGIAAGVYLELRRVDTTGGTLIGRGVLTERERIVLADFISPTGDILLASLATVAFRIDLAQSPILTLIEPQQVQAALARMERSDVRLLDAQLAREVAVREGIKAVLAGEIARSGSGYLLSAQLLAAETGEILAAYRGTARDSTALLPALDRLSKQLRRRIGESLRSVQANPPLHQVTTSSLAALRKYSQAMEISAREGNDARVIGLLEESIALDSSFAMAYIKLSVALLDVFGRTARQSEMLTRAYQHRDRLTDRERYILLAIYYGFHTREPEKAITALRTHLETYTHDASALHNLSVSYMMLGDYVRAEEYARRALAVDSGNPVTRMILGDWQFNQGKHTEAEATFQSFAARFPGYSLTGYRFIHLAAAQGDHAGAANRARQERAARPEDLDLQVEMAQHQADLAAVRGRLGELRQLTLDVGKLAEQRGTPGLRLTESLNQARLESTVGRSPARALERVERELATRPLSEHDVRDRPYADLAALYARAGQPRRARALLAEWEALTSADVLRNALLRERPQRGNALPWALGEVALAEGRPLEAAQQFRLARQRSCLICMLPQLGRAYEAAGQPDSAVAVYERYLGTSFLFRLHTDAEWRAEVLERLGQLYEARGDYARAAEHYAQFIELWQDADPELQPRVREARWRVAALW
jgi:eukaryotic-like serine/threonine-protein kinase